MRLVIGLVCPTILFLLQACGGGDGGQQGSPPDPGLKVELGKLIFEDTRLSAEGNQSCASCHDASAGFADPPPAAITGKLPSVSDGSVAGQSGTRNAPSSAYAGFAPVFGKTMFAGTEVFVGGQFLDGRRDTLEEQAKDPFLNPVEMANANKLEVVNKIRTASYADKFTTVFGASIFDNTDNAYDKVAVAIAAFERSAEMNKFNSKFDCYLQDKEAYPLTTSEQAGLDTFNGPIARCSECHTSEAQPPSGKVLFTNFMYFNIGVPRNDAIPGLDRGLGDRGDITNASEENGKFKTPSLRNVAITAPYMHNGVFDTLEDVMVFYNNLEHVAADPPPEFSSNIASEVDIEISVEDESNIIAFMKTLTDGTGMGICF